MLLLDEPDNYLDLSAKRWLERRIQSSRKTIFLISHDRELLTTSTDTIVTMEGFGAWVHPGSFATYDEARARPQRRPRGAAGPVERRGAAPLPALQDHEGPGGVQRRQRPAGQRRRDPLEAVRRRSARRPRRRKDQFLRMRLGGARSGDRVLDGRGARDRRADRAVLRRAVPRRPGRARSARTAAARATSSGCSAATTSVEVDGAWRTGASVTVGPVPPDRRGRLARRPHAAGGARLARPRRRRRDERPRPVRPRRVRPPTLRDPERWAEGPHAGARPRAAGRQPAAARRAHRQPRPGVGRGADPRPRPVHRAPSCA